MDFYNNVVEQLLSDQNSLPLGQDSHGPVDPSEISLRVLVLAYDIADHLLLNNKSAKSKQPNTQPIAGILHLSQTLEKCGAKVITHNKHFDKNNMRKIFVGALPDVIISQSHAIPLAAHLAMEIQVPFVLFAQEITDYSKYFRTKLGPLPQLIICQDADLAANIKAINSAQNIILYDQTETFIPPTRTIANKTTSNTNATTVASSTTANASASSSEASQASLKSAYVINEHQRNNIVMIDVPASISVQIAKGCPRQNFVYWSSQPVASLNANNIKNLPVNTSWSSRLQDSKLCIYGGSELEEVGRKYLQYNLVPLILSTEVNDTTNAGMWINRIRHTLDNYDSICQTILKELESQPQKDSVPQSAVNVVQEETTVAPIVTEEVISVDKDEQADNVKSSALEIYQFLLSSKGYCQRDYYDKKKRVLLEAETHRVAENNHIAEQTYHDYIAQQYDKMADIYHAFLGIARARINAGKYDEITSNYLRRAESLLPERREAPTEHLRLLRYQDNVAMALNLANSLLRCPIDEHTNTWILQCRYPLELARTFKHAGHYAIAIDHYRKVLVAPILVAAERKEWQMELDECLAFSMQDSENNDEAAVIQDNVNHIHHAQLN